MNLELIAISLVAIVAGGVASVSGFGVGSLLTPLLSLSMDLQLAVAAVSIPHLIGTAFRFALIRQHVSKDVFMKFGIWSAAGGLLGGLLGIMMHDRILIIVFAGLLIFAGATGLFGYADKMRIAEKLSWLAGLVSGVFGGLVGNQGGIRSAALMSFHLSKEEFVATATAIALLVDGARLPVYLINRSGDLADLWLPISVASVAIVAGTWIGQLILHKIPERLFKKIVSAIILLLGISMLIKSFEPTSH